MVNVFRETCPVCEASEYLHKISENYDDRYGYPGQFSLTSCSRCGHIFLNAAFSEEQISNLYSEYYPRSSFKLENLQPHQERTGFDAWLDGAKSSAFRWIPRNIRILDIGCGFGESLGYHQARGCEVFGVEADENITRIAERFGYNVHVGQFDAKHYAPNSFDYVTMDQVFEHVQNPIKVLNGIAQILKPGGIAILSLPNADGWGAKLFKRKWINWHAPYHLHFFSETSMKLATEHAGLSVDRIATITPSAWLHYQWIHLLTFPMEGQPSVFWMPGRKKSLMQKIIIKALSYLHHCKVNHVVTRCFDALGKGDNRLYFLRKPR